VHPRNVRDMGVTQSKSKYRQGGGPKESYSKIHSIEVELGERLHEDQSWVPGGGRYGKKTIENCAARLGKEKREMLNPKGCWWVPSLCREWELCRGEGQRGL